jgi:hypothetical protein
MDILKGGDNVKIKSVKKLPFIDISIFEIIVIDDNNNEFNLILKDNNIYYGPFRVFNTKEDIIFKDDKIIFKGLEESEIKEKLKNILPYFISKRYL